MIPKDSGELLDDLMRDSAPLVRDPPARPMGGRASGNGRRKPESFSGRKQRRAARAKIRQIDANSLLDQFE